MDDFDVVFIETSTPTYLPESEYETTDDIDLKLNDFVCVNGKKYGYLRYIGNSHFMSVITCGIELKEADGKYDGEKDQIRLVKQRLKKAFNAIYTLNVLFI